jgi:hypothetical protein
MRPGKSRVMVTVSVSAGTKVTAAGGICMGGAVFLPQPGSSSQMTDIGKNRIGRMMGGLEKAQTIVRRRLSIA